MVFDKSHDVLIEPIYIETVALETVKEWKYLGITLVSSRSTVGPRYKGPQGTNQF